MINKLTTLLTKKKLSIFFGFFWFFENLKKRNDFKEIRTVIQYFDSTLTGF